MIFELYNLKKVFHHLLVLVSNLYRKMSEQQADKWFETNMDVWYDAIVDITFR